MGNDLVSINKEKINNLIIQLDNSEQKIKKILDNIAEEYSTINSNVSYQGTQTYNAKKRVIYEMMDVICDNIEVYKDDLMAVKKKFTQTETKAANEIRAATRKINVGTEYKSQ